MSYHLGDAPLSIEAFKASQTPAQIRAMEEQGGTGGPALLAARLKAAAKLDQVTTSSSIPLLVPMSVASPNDAQVLSERTIVQAGNGVLWGSLGYVVGKKIKHPWLGVLVGATYPWWGTAAAMLGMPALAMPLMYSQRAMQRALAPAPIALGVPR